jgi:hypothetical protein
MVSFTSVFTFAYQQSLFSNNCHFSFDLARSFLCVHVTPADVQYAGDDEHCLGLR